MTAPQFIWGGTVSPWRVTATPGTDGIWLVRFVKTAMSLEAIDQTAAWLPSGEWDHRRWWPHGALVPPALRVHVEQWLRDHPLLREVG